MKVKLTQRQKLEKQINNYPARSVSWELAGVICHHGFAVYTDEIIEQLFINLRKSEQFRRKMNAENHVRLDS